MAEINVTPMVDVMLVLLIIFMVTAPLMMAGVQVDLPESKAEAVQQEQEQEPVAISIDAAGAMFIGDEPIGQAQLPARLQQIRAASSEEGGPRIMFRADRGLDYGIVMRVMGEINRAGLRRIALVSVASGGG